MTSARLPRDLSPNAATRLLITLREQGIRVTDLTESNPTRVGLSYPEDLLTPLASPRALAYDPLPLGLLAARTAVSSDFARRGLDVAAERIALTASTSEAYALLFKLLCDPGDAVLVPQPSYPLFDHLTALESVRATPYRLEYHGTWRIDVDDLQRAVDQSTRALLIVSPNNPTGSFLHSDDLVAVAQLCSQHDLVLIGDEVFADYPLDASPRAVSVLQAADIPTCSLGGLSKSMGLPQLKLGWIGFGGPTVPVATLIDAYEVVADTYLSVSTPVQAALPELLTHALPLRQQIQTRLERNLVALRAAAAAVPEVRVLRVEGGWSAVLQVPAYESEEAMVLDLLENDHVLVHPGYFFDFDREAFLIVSLLVEPAAFDEAVARVLRRVSRPGFRA
ncbi:MAG TPA: pyridoxal phosphate-dependent aminotransferase [Vicinamibacterales bacterium]|nr:pyridoxal phosphate-dependent aminotransferase [Vicinamibacterales bacterium]